MQEHGAEVSCCNLITTIQQIDPPHSLSVSQEVHSNQNLYRHEFGAFTLLLEGCISLKFSAAVGYK